MPRSHHLWRRIGLFVAVGAWAFALLSFGSFSPRDWPSHAVYPHPATANLCGPAGAWIAYYCFFWLGQGVFPVLLLCGIALVVTIFRGSVNDLWMRATGLVLTAVAYAAVVHNVRPGSMDGFPEGNGGMLGIGTASFLQTHFSTAGTCLMLTLVGFIGLLLAADDLLARTPGIAMAAAAGVRDNLPRVKLPSVRLPPLPRFRPGAASAAAAAKPPVDDADEDLRPVVLLQRNASRLIKRFRGDDMDEVPLVYDHDEPAIGDAAMAAEHDPVPAAPVTIPSPSASPRLAALPAPTPVEVHAVTTSAVDDAEVTDGQPPAMQPPEIRPDIVVKLPSAMKPTRQSPPPAPPRELGEYHLPQWDVLENSEHGYVESQEKFVREQAAMLEQTLREFSIDAHVVEIDTGPVITMYELALAPGIKVSTISGLSNDIQRALKAETVRIVAPIPGKSTVGIEVPNAQKEKVRLKELMQLAPEAMGKMAIPLFLGKDASGEPLITDLAAMPHCLIAGTTGSGKSVCINTIIMSVMYLQRPDAVKLILVDPKVVEMAPFKDIPHLMCPVINDTGRATSVLDWACEKMDERYEFLAEAGVRNIKDYNRLSADELKERFNPSTPEEEAKIPKKLPYIVIIIDELADLMMTSGKEVEAFIVRLAQKARAVGIHLILATQRPQATVVTGLIKSNMPSKIAFRVASRMDSRIVLDQNGAELLLGQGDMLFLPPGASKPMRGQGTFIDDKEIRDSVKLVKTLADAQYEPELVQIKATNISADGEMEKDELFDDAVRVVLETKRGSVSLLQRRLTIGYARASRLIEMMAQTGIVGDYKGSQAREAMLTAEEWEAMKAQQIVDAESGMSV